MKFENDVCGDSVLVQRGHFLIKTAENAEEIKNAQKLRYQVFMAEQGHMSGGNENGMDEDCYDRQFTHLLVMDKAAGRTVGTYRMQSGLTAVAGRGFYSSSEYDIDGLEAIAADTWEVGRSCVAPEYRSGAVIALLWAGIAEVRRRTGFRYLIGCGSLEPGQSSAGWPLYEYFRESGLLSSDIKGVARPDFRMPADVPESEQYRRMEESELKKLLPPLFKGYLRAGAKIAGEPAFDRNFGSVDFLIILDFEAMSARYARHFVQEAKA